MDAACDRAPFPAITVDVDTAFDRTLVERVHDPDYVDFLETAHQRWVDEGHDTPCAMAFGWPTRRFRAVVPETLEAQLGYYSFAADCSIGAATWTAVKASAATAIAAADHVAAYFADQSAQSPPDGGPVVAFARCRPPSHHASRDQFGGYCYLNNSALAAQRLLDRGAERVAVVDVDYHHGNGTQDIFYDRGDVLHASIHADPAREFPYFLGYQDETGIDAGLGANRNIPLPRGTDPETWFNALDEALTWACDPGAGSPNAGATGAGPPRALVVPLGVDTFQGDPISHFRLTSDGFIRLGRRLAQVNLPTVLILEGGYATEALGVNVVNVLTGFSGFTASSER